MTPVLSILIATQPARYRKLNRLLQHLQYQIGDKPVQVLCDDGPSVLGTKRQVLLKAATGQYVCVVDDDDFIADDYIDRVLQGCSEGKDCCSLDGIVVMNSGNLRPFFHSIEHKAWSEEPRGYLRMPNHLNAVKRELALQAGFPDMGYGEDHEFSKRLLPLLQTEAKIPGVLYHYFEGSSDAARICGQARIMVKWATRGRPRLFEKTLAEHVRNLSGNNEVFFVVSTDEDDPTAPEITTALEKSQVDFHIYSGEANRGKIKAINADVNDFLEDFDFIIVAADDIIPTEKNYDDRIVMDVLRNMPSLDGVLVYDDGFQRPKPGVVHVATVPVIGRVWYERYGYIYHPEYQSLFCDQELSDVAIKEGKFHHVQRLLLKHEWIGGVNPDDLLRRNESFYKADEKVYERRKTQGFPKGMSDVLPE